MKNTPSYVSEWRKHFPCLHQEAYGRPLVYLDNAATSQKPVAVINEVKGYYEKYCGNVNRGVHFLSEHATNKAHRARKIVADFIRAGDPSSIIFTRGATESLNLVAQCLASRLSPHDEILVTEMEHHANIVPWYFLQQKMDIVIKVVPINGDGELDLEALPKLVTDKTKIFAFSHASNALGTINPIKKLAEFCRTHNLISVVDGAQAVHHVPVDVAYLDVDFYAFSGHKAYAPTGIGVLYGKKNLLDEMPPYQGGGEMISSVSFDHIEFAKAPEKFEAGTPNIAGILGLGAALEYFMSLDQKALFDHEQELHDYALAELKKLPHVHVFGNAKEKVPLISFKVEGIHPHDLASIFDREGVAIRAGHLCAQPLIKRFNETAFSRASFAFYNTFDEVDALIRAFHQAFKVFSL